MDHSQQGIAKMTTTRTSDVTPALLNGYLEQGRQARAEAFMALWSRLGRRLTGHQDTGAAAHGQTPAHC